MRISKIQCISCTGRIKTGDIKRKLVDLSNKFDQSLSKVEAKSEVAMNSTINKLFEDPENLKAIDYTKITAIDTSVLTSTTGTVGGALTSYSNSGPLLSTIFPSSF